MTPFVRAPAAEFDLQEIWLAIASDSPAAATRMVRSIGARINRLRIFPRLGQRRPEILPSARVLVEGPYLILYETHPDTDDGPIEEVEIVRVVDGRRDLTKPF